MDCQTGKRHYEVVSPSMVFHPSYGLSDSLVCWGFYLAKNAKDAIRQAVADPAFSEWVNEQRADNQPPFRGLKASLTLCEHGVCWECEPCSQCRAEDDWKEFFLEAWKKS